MKDKKFSTIHAINKKGERKIISYIDPLKKKSIHEEVEQKTNDGYYIDIDWYLKNGYHLIDDVITEFEQKLKNDNNNQL